MHEICTWCGHQIQIRYIKEPIQAHNMYLVHVATGKRVAGVAGWSRDTANKLKVFICPVAIFDSEYDPSKIYPDELDLDLQPLFDSYHLKRGACLYE